MSPKIKHLISIISQSSNNASLIKNIIIELAKVLQADICCFFELTPRGDKFLPLAEESEYTSSQKIKRKVGLDLEDDENLPIKKEYLKRKNIIINDINTLDKKYNQKFLAILKKNKIKSYFAFPVIYKENFWGIVSLSFIESKKKLIKSDLDYLYTAFYLLALSLNEFKTVKISKREKLIRNAINIIRQSFNYEEIRNQLAVHIGEAFEADRTFFRILNKKKNLYEKHMLVEYKPNKEVVSFEKFVFTPEMLVFFMRTVPRFENVYLVEDAINYYSKINVDYSLQNKMTQYFIDANIGTDVIVILWNNSYEIAYFVLHYVGKSYYLTSEEIELLNVVSEQLVVAFNQAGVYEQTVEREKSLSRIIEKIRSTLDVSEIKKIFVTEMGKILNADRVVFSEYEVGIYSMLPIEKEAEYRSSSESYSLVDVNLKQYKLYNDAFREGQEIVFDDREKFIKDFNLYALPEAKLLYDGHIRSNYAAPVNFGNKPLGVIAIHFSQHKRPFPEEEIKFIRTFVSQAGIALHQARLYQKEKKVAERERIIRKMIEKIRISQSLDEVYNYVILRILDIFNLSRVIFLETPTFKYETPSISYEKSIEKPLLLETKEKLPKELNETFEKMAEELSHLVVEDYNRFDVENNSVSTFLKKYNMISFIGMPMVRYNEHIKILGVIIVCDNKPRNWSEHEINLLKSIMDSVITVIWEISKIIEINELREAFIATLAHDLQVPLIGESKALEFLNSRAEDEKIGNYSEIISSLINDHQNLITLLKKLLDSYYYEAGKKILNIKSHDISLLIYKAVNELEGLANKKLIDISLKIQEDLPEINVDQEEIYKVIFYILENAIIYTQEGGKVWLKVSKKRDNIEICISDNGPGIPPKIREKIFERYTMSLEIERKIGSGLSIYLSKQILEAHHGEINLETKLKKGTVFNLILPINNF